MVYPALLPLMLSPRLPIVDWTDAPADLNGIVRFAERRNLVSLHVPSHFKWPVRQLSSITFFSKLCFINLSIIRIYSNLESELLTVSFYTKLFKKVLLNTPSTQSWRSICDIRVNKYGLSVELHWQKRPNCWDMEQVLVPFRHHLSHSKWPAV